MICSQKHFENYETLELTPRRSNANACRLWIAMLSSIFIGLGDACFNTQIYSLLMR